MSGASLSVTDLAIDHALAQTAASMQFLLDVTPVNADEVKADFVDGRVGPPEFTYRPLEIAPEVLTAALHNIDVSTVEDATLGHLLRAKHRELALQFDMLRARDTDRAAVRAWVVDNHSLVETAKRYVEVFRHVAARRARP